MRYIKAVNKKYESMNHETTPYTPEASFSHLSTKANYVGHYLIAHLFSHNIFRSCQAGPTDKISKREVRSHCRKPTQTNVFSRYCAVLTKEYRPTHFHIIEH